LKILLNYLINEKDKMNCLIKITDYMLFENKYNKTLKLKGILNSNSNNKWYAILTVINTHCFTIDEIKELINKNNERVSYHLIKEILYKIYVEYLSEEIDPLINNYTEWSENTNYSMFNIPKIIWCSLIGQISTIL
jgi:hypothetical protein